MQTHGCDISLVTSRKTWELFASEVNGPVVVDFETNGHPIWAPDFKVIGIGLAFYVAGNLRGFYIPVFESEQVAPKQFKLVKSRAESGLVRDVVNWLNGKNVIAHNISFDGCILKQLEVKCNFFYDTMIGLHLLLPGETYIPKKDHTGQFIRNPKTGKFQMERRSLRLKWAMQNILGWPETNEKEANDFIRKNKHKKGQDLWICPLDLIWSYGALDAIATFRLYEAQMAEMKELNSNQIMRYLLDYCDLLCDQTLQGTNFDRESAFVYAKQLNQDIATAQETFMKMSEDKIIACGIANFNINSNKHLVKLFFDDRGFAYTPISFTENGDPEITKDTLRAYGRPGACLAAYKTKSKLKQFLDSYLEHSTDGKIHIQSNVCGQLSGRVSQRDPSLLQMPRRDSRMMQLFKAEPGWSLLQADYCLHPKTEILTPKGWVNIMQVTENDEVWQVNKDTLHGSFVKPQRIIKREYTGEMHTFKTIRGSLSVTDNHTMLWVGQQTHKRKDKQRYRNISMSQNGLPTSGCHMPTSSYSTSYSEYSEYDIWMSCMLQADGHYTEYDSYQVEVSKKLKRDKIKELLQRTGTIRPPRELQTLETETWSGIKFKSNLLIPGKEKKLNLISLGGNQVDVFLEALSFWDSWSDHRHILYSSTSEHNINEIQAYLVKNGYEAKKMLVRKETPKHKKCWALTIRKFKGIRLQAKDHIKEDYTGEVGCVTVPEGFILVRSEGQTFVTGNCALEPSVLTAFSRDKVLRDIYTNPDDNKNFDVYLELGLRMNFLIDGEKCKDLVSRYYYSGMPSKEFGEAKKMLKKVREKLKVVQLALGYAGTEMTLMETLKIPYDDATLIYKDYWETFKGVRLFENFIKERLKQGPLYTFHGRPLKIAPNRLKDSLNTLIQASGHDILMHMNLEVQKEIKKRGILMKPYVADFHDEAIYTFRNDYADEALDILNTAIKTVNDYLKSTGWFDFELKAPPQVVKRRPYWALKDLSEIEK